MASYLEEMRKKYGTTDLSPNRPTTAEPWPGLLRAGAPLVGKGMQAIQDFGAWSAGALAGGGMTPYKRGWLPWWEQARQDVTPDQLASAVAAGAKYRPPAPAQAAPVAPPPSEWPPKYVPGSIPIGPGPQTPAPPPSQLAAWQPVPATETPAAPTWAEIDAERQAREAANIARQEAYGVKQAGIRRGLRESMGASLSVADRRAMAAKDATTWQRGMQERQLAQQGDLAQKQMAYQQELARLRHLAGPVARAEAEGAAGLAQTEAQAKAAYDRAVLDAQAKRDVETIRSSADWARFSQERAIAAANNIGSELRTLQGKSAKINLTPQEQQRITDLQGKLDAMRGSTAGGQVMFQADIDGDGKLDNVTIEEALKAQEMMQRVKQPDPNWTAEQKHLYNNGVSIAKAYEAYLRKRAAAMFPKA